MSDEMPATKKPRTTKSSATPADPATEAAPEATIDATEPVEAEVVEERVIETPDETVVEETVVVEETDATAVTPATPAATVGGQPQVIYVTQPAPPARRGNRGFGALIALASALLFVVVFALAGALIEYAFEGVFTFDFLGASLFWVPVLLFAVGFVLLALISNRANWWAYILGSILVGLFVYFGTIGVRMLAFGVIQDPASAGEMFAAQLLSPSTIVAGLLAREISLWVGAAISRRGRRVKTRNAEARAAYERDLEEKRAERERYGAPA